MSQSFSPPEHGPFDWLDVLLDQKRNHQPVLLATMMDGPEAGAKWVVGPAGMLLGPSGPEGAAVVGAALPALASGRPTTVQLEGVGRLYLEPHLPAPILVVVGAGHVAQPVATAGRLAGFEVVVLDDRPSFVTASRFPEADQLICDEFLHGLDSLNLGRRHHVVLVTRGHQHDLACLRHVITIPLAYLGMIGSRRRVMGVFQRLIDEGIDPEVLKCVHAPIGLDIGAETPGEIAISIAAELVKSRRGGTGESLSERLRGNIHRFRRLKP
jgi:xanthine dehydrogenase accessory factor